MDGWGTARGSGGGCPRGPDDGWVGGGNRGLDEEGDTYCLT